MTIAYDATTRLDKVNAQDAARLAQLHPAFAPDGGIPGDASLGAIAQATGLPLELILTYACGEIHVKVHEGQSCGGGCGCSH